MSDFSEISLDLINQGSALMAQENFEEALKKFKEAQQESPKYVECYLNLGNVLACLENYEEDHGNSYPISTQLKLLIGVKDDIRVKNLNLSKSLVLLLIIKLRLELLMVPR